MGCRVIGWPVVMLVVIALTGSLWVMYHMNQNMTPMSVQDMRTLP